MRRSFSRNTGLVGLLLASALLFACDGSTGPAGPAGAPGTAGPPGDPGTSGPPGSSSGNAIPVDSAEKINVEVQDVTVPAGGGAPTVTLRLSDDLDFGLKGLPASTISFTLAQLTAGQDGSSSEWQSYVTRDSGGIANAQAGTESGAAGTFTDNGDGTYTYIFANPLTAYPAGPTFDAAKTHRLGLEIRSGAPANNAPYDFVPAGGSPIETRLIANNATCNACHDNLGFHGEARFDIEYCVTCHNPYSIDGDTVNETWGGTVDMKRMIHKIHYGENLTDGYFIIGHGDRTHDYSNIVFPQDVRNCTTCHQESDASVPQASNWRQVQNRDACGSCHDWIDWDGSENDPNLLHPGGFSFLGDTDCVVCHGHESTAFNGDLHVDVVHEIPEVLAQQAFSFQIVNILDTNVGDFPTIEYRVNNPVTGVAWDLLNDAEWTTCGPARLAVGIAWDTADYHNNGAATPGLPVSISAIPCSGGAPVAVAGQPGVFSVTSLTAVPANAGGSLAATIDGHAAVDIDGTLEEIAVTNVVGYAAIGANPLATRRNAVDIDKCDDCHNQLSMHGGNRTDNIEVCVTCHAPNVTDINRRAGQCATDLGTDDNTVDMKVMIHALHAFDFTEEAYEACGFAFPSGGTPHTFDFIYPGKLNNCEGCHVEDGFYPVDPAVVLGTTVDANDPAIQTDDVVVSPNSAVCSSCHVSSLAANHMIQNGGDFNATKDADSNLVSSGVETCQLCHGPGASADTGVMHRVGEFQFN